MNEIQIPCAYDLESHSASLTCCHAINHSEISIFPVCYSCVISDTSNFDARLPLLKSGLASLAWDGWTDGGAVANHIGFCDLKSERSAGSSAECFFFIDNPIATASQFCIATAILLLSRVLWWQTCSSPFCRRETGSQARPHF